MYILSHIWLTLIMLLGRWNQLLLSRLSLVTEYWTMGKVHIHASIYTSIQKATLSFTGAENMQICQYISNWFFDITVPPHVYYIFIFRCAENVYICKNLQIIFSHHHYTFSYYVYEKVKTGSYYTTYPRFLVYSTYVFTFTGYKVMNGRLTVNHADRSDCLRLRYYHCIYMGRLQKSPNRCQNTWPVGWELGPIFPTS
jgi:hypothetical protein